MHMHILGTYIKLGKHQTIELEAIHQHDPTTNGTNQSRGQAESGVG